MGITCERWKPIGKVQKSRQKSILAHRDYVLKILTNSSQKAQNKFLGSQHNISLSHGQAHWSHSYRYHLLLICLTILSRLTVTVRKYVISEPCNKHFVYYWQISLISIQKKNNSRNNQGHHSATKKYFSIVMNRWLHTRGNICWKTLKKRAKLSSRKKKKRAKLSSRYSRS